jgi:hypothetical protein
MPLTYAFRLATGPQALDQAILAAESSGPQFPTSRASRRGVTMRWRQTPSRGWRRLCTVDARLGWRAFEPLT